MKRIQSKLLRIGTYVVCKCSLSCFDDKRDILDDDIDTLAYFHKEQEINKTRLSRVNQVTSIKVKPIK